MKIGMDALNAITDKILTYGPSKKKPAKSAMAKKKISSRKARKKSSGRT
jgi:hypothetical protein